MKAIERAMAFFNFTRELYASEFHIMGELRRSQPVVSRNSKRTKGRKFASQKIRANRRKSMRKKHAM